MIYWGYMNISNKYIVKLSAREQRQIKGIMRKGTHQAQAVKRASVLWKSHKGMKDKEYMFSSKGFAVKIPLQEFLPDEKAVSQFKTSVLDFVTKVKSSIIK